MSKERTIDDAITLAKKYNVALQAVKKEKNEYKWNKLEEAEYDFRVKLTEEDKNNLKKDRKELINELNKEQLHLIVARNIQNIFIFENKKNDGATKTAPTKESAEMLNKFSELIGLLSKANGISTSQIRKFLDALRKIKTSISKDEFNPSEVLLLQVKVAYTAGRNRNLNFFYDVMKPAIEYGSRDKFHFEQLLRFVEAIVAYHRFYKGEN